jgi:nitrous oxidase accessory protein
VQNNEIKNSSVGIYIAGSLGTKVTNNTVKGSLGSATSMGILLKGASDTSIKENSIGQCNQALYIDKSPMKQDTKNWILDNKIMFTTIGLDFRGSSYRNVIKKNDLFGNMDNIMTDSYTGRTNENEITGNYWDDYEGFDLDMDNVGDTSYKKYLYFDQIWIKHPEVRFFYGSPIVSILNFMLKIAPFVEPIFLMEDEKPRFKIEK